MMLSGCRILQCNSRQLGICSFNCNKNCCSYLNKAPRPPSPPPPPPLRQFPLSTCYTSLLKFKLLGTNASSSPSSSTSPVTNNNDDLAGLSFINNASQPPLLSDCLTPAENDNVPPYEGISSLAGGIVALGKFDALHIGHRELAIQAAKIGVPFLLSFIGMAEILGWEPRAPVVAKCDRKRVLSSWAPLCGNITPKEFHVEFSKVRNLTPQQFVEKLSVELKISGVVAGENYRFGYKAAGDSSDLVRLCKEYGMKASIVNPVMDKKNRPESKDNMDSNNSNEQGQVSSTRVRRALANGDMGYVSELLGRNHRLIITPPFVVEKNKRLSAPRSCLLNLPPKEGVYRNCSLVIGDGDDDGNVVIPCGVVIDTTDIHLEFDELARHVKNITAARNLGIDFW
ncbi:hypothetical protein CASFOL_007042 [Castilleja foliolosa]|uniref:FAD synthase n=1 Tax=Castilleja foliolosa TaxID=1961234 RepID=A0ABD3E907_9LAMI